MNKKIYEQKGPKHPIYVGVAGDRAKAVFKGQGKTL